MELEYRQFSSNIIKYTNESPLPWEFKRLALKDILGQVESEVDKILQSELEAQNKANTSAEREV